MLPDPTYDAVLLLSFGGPERPEDVRPFLAQVLRGRPVPPERLEQVVHHYELFGGRSPLNDQCRALLAALRAEMQARALPLPLYWGNRNWHPFLADTLREMAAAGVRRALAFATSAYGSYSGCRQYLEDIAQARAAVGPGAPAVDKLRLFHDHPGFVAANAERLLEARARIPAERRSSSALVFSAHSVPVAMAAASPYVAQLQETCRLVAQAAGLTAFELVYQSRSGPATQAWLEPDICDHLRTLHARGIRDVLLGPLGFLSDHMEVVYDLDTEARAVAQGLGLSLWRAGTVGTHAQFVAMVRELIEERLEPGRPRRALGSGPAGDVCRPDCCAGPRPGRPA